MTLLDIITGIVSSMGLKTLIKLGVVGLVLVMALLGGGANTQALLSAWQNNTLPVL